MNRILLLSGTLGLLLMAGCRKDDVIDCAPKTTSTVTPPVVTPPVVTPPVVTPPTTAPTSNLSLSSFFLRNGAPTQRLGFIIGQSQPLQTQGGATFSVNQVGFQTPGGTPARDSAYLYLREIYTVPDMVLSNMPTTAQGSQQVLISGGEFSLQVYQRGTRLYTAGGVVTSSGSLPVLTSPIPPNQDTTPQLFWKQPAYQPGWQATGQGVQTVGNTYRVGLALDSLPLHNIDQLWHAYQTATPVAVSIATPATTSGSTRVYLQPIGYNGLASTTPGATLGSTTSSWTAIMPTGASLKAIVLQSVNGQLYFGTQVFQVQSGSIITPALTAVSESQMAQLIRQL